MTCTVPGCAAPHVARGMCRRHYSRWRRGKPLTDPAQPAHGAPSGHGLYGILDDDGETVLCHECGDRYRSVAAHLAAGAHDGLTARDYKLTHGLRLGTALASQTVRAELSARSRARVGSPGWSRLEAARNPAAAAAARDTETWRAIGRQPDLPARAAKASAARAADRAPRLCVVCGTPTTGRRRTCSTACQTVRQSTGATTARPDNRHRDAQIIAAANAGEDWTMIGRRYGLGRERIGQIVRAAHRT